MGRDPAVERFLLASGWKPGTVLWHREPRNRLAWRRKTVLYRTLGKTGLEVSVLGLGGHEYRWGLHQGHLAEGRFTELNPERLRVVERALGLGVNYADTTFVEEVQSLGACLRKLQARDQVIVSGMVIAPMRRWKGASRREIERNYTRELEERLDLLGDEMFDIYLLGVLHQDYDEGMVKTLYELLARSRERGQTRFIGVSAHRYSVLSRFLDLGLSIDVAMMPYSFPAALNWGGLYDDLPGFLEQARARSIGLVGIKSLVWTLYGVPCSIHDISDRSISAVLRTTLAWQCRQEVLATTVVGVETVPELESDLQAVDAATGERLLEERLNALLAHARRFDVLMGNAPAHTAEVQDRILEFAREFTEHDFGRDWEAYERYWRDGMGSADLPFLKPGS